MVFISFSNMIGKIIFKSVLIRRLIFCDLLVRNILKMSSFKNTMLTIYQTLLKSWYFWIWAILYNFFYIQKNQDLSRPWNTLVKCILYSGFFAWFRVPMLVHHNSTLKATRLIRWPDWYSMNTARIQDIITDILM